MSVPEHLWRFPTADAIASLAARFGRPNHPRMQDWEWEVADPTRLEEFIEAYETAGLSDDERFTLMETIIQSFEDSDEQLARSALWARVLRLLEASIDLHIYSVWYWSDLDEDPERLFRVTPFIRKLLASHRARFESPAGTQK